MILLRQKIFFNYSGYSVEDAARIKEERRAQAKALLAERKVAMNRMNNSIDFSRRGMEKSINELGSLNLGNRATGEMKQSLIENHQNNVNKNYQARNEAYQKALDNSNKFKADLDKKYKRTLPTTNNPNSNPYNTSILGNTYKNRGVTTTKTIPQTQQKTGMGFGKKVAIGAGVAAAGYGAYRFIKSRRKKQKQKEEQTFTTTGGNGGY